MNAVDWDEKYQAADRLWSAGPNMFVADRLGNVPAGAGLDLASGEGRNAIWLAERGWEMTAVDFSEVAVERGRAVSDRVEWEVADVREWRPDRVFDLVVIAYLHLVEQEMREVVTRAASWLEGGGELFMIGHDRSNIERGHGGPQVSEILWETDLLRSWIEGMVVVESQVVRRPVDTPEGSKVARDTLVRARQPVDS